MTPFDPVLLAVCALVGAIAGFLGGLLGIGGGVIIVPALLLLFDARGFPTDLAPTMAVATSLATIVFTSLSAARAQRRRGAVDWALVRRWTPGLLLGSLASGIVARALPGTSLKLFIGIFLATAAVVMLARWRPQPQRVHPARAGSALISTAAGLVSGLAGIGGGNVIVPTLAFFNIPIQRAAATSSTLGVPISVAGTLGFALAGLDAVGRPPGSIGFIYAPAALSIALVAFLLAPAGVALAHRLPAEWLRRIFGVLLLTVSARILGSVLL
ncbi:MAG: sulfite exporter TauE/SafE family protein [Pseudomonadales bacterium]|jgi:uncharacterized membrane protein YfcA|nr:sulfite exporter TauE/SafE family protein [Pseudomonadales bacterium]